MRTVFSVDPAIDGKPVTSSSAPQKGPPEQSELSVTGAPPRGHVGFKMTNSPLACLSPLLEERVDFECTVRRGSPNQPRSHGCHLKSWPWFTGAGERSTGVREASSGGLTVQCPPLRSFGGFTLPVLGSPSPDLCLGTSALLRCPASEGVSRRRAVFPLQASLPSTGLSKERSPSSQDWPGETCAAC